MSVVEYLADKEELWSRVQEKHGLRRIPLADIVGESHHYAEFCLACGATEPPPPAFSSRIKLQQAGFTGCFDTQETFNYWLQDLIGRRLIPGPVSEQAHTSRDSRQVAVA
jgi:hypothetical protein